MKTFKLKNPDSDMASQEVFEGLSTGILETYNTFVSVMPVWLQEFTNLFVVILLIFLYSVFVWIFYKSISKRDIIKLDLNKYNTADHPVLIKFLAAVFYFTEYIIILPLIIFLGFALFTLLMIFLTEELSTSALLLISATIIATIRLTAYFREEIAKDLAKLIPLTFLAVSLLTPGFFSVERIIGKLTEMPMFIDEIFIYLVFIMIMEIVLRFFNFIFSLLHIEDTEVEDYESDYDKKNNY